MVEIVDVLTIDRRALDAEKERLVRGVLRAGKHTITEATKVLERDLEALTRSAVPGRLWRAWKSDVFPKGAALAREPVGVVYVNGGARSRGAISFFTRPGRIKGRSGQYLAIPTPAAGSRGRGRDLTPKEWERRTGAKLRFVYRRGKPSLLVVDEAVLSGKKQVARLNTERRRASGRGNTTIVVFFLVPFVSYGNKIAIDPVVHAAGADLGKDFATRVKSLP
jgi:hypothetical protein